MAVTLVSDIMLAFMCFCFLFVIASTGVFTASDLSRVIKTGETDVPFAIEGTVQHDCWTGYNYFAIADSNGTVILNRTKEIPRDDLRAGNKVRAFGVTVQGERQFACADCTNVEVICSGKAPSPQTVCISDFNSGAFDARYIRLIGTVRGVFRDERSKGFIYLALADTMDAAYAAFQDMDSESSDYTALVG